MDITKVCGLCNFFHVSKCQRFPPTVKTTYISQIDGNESRQWEQPVIHAPWTTRCGEWQEINIPSNRDDLEANQPKTPAGIRLGLIADGMTKERELKTEYEKELAKYTKETNDNRSRTNNRKPKRRRNRK